MKKIKLFCWWTSSEQITYRFKKQFIGNKFVNENIEFVTDDSYDYAAVFGNTNNQILVDKDHTLYFFQEPYWSQNWDRDAFKKSSRVFCPSKALYANPEEFIESPAYMFYGGHGDLHSEFEWDWSVESMIEISPKKDKLLSLIQRKQIFHAGNNVLYSDRCNLADFLNQSDIELDIFGAGYWEKDNKKVKGEIWNKKVGLNDYKFSIAIENTYQPNYITEKFFDCILTNTVPVYYGCSNITDIIPENCFIRLPDISDKESCLKVIKEQCTHENYNVLVNNINKLKENYWTNTNYNLWAKIQQELFR